MNRAPHPMHGGHRRAQPSGMIDMPPVEYDTVLMEGGWDQLTPTIKLGPGFMRDVQNFECVATGGYARIGGYERFDGRTSPSSASYVLVQISSFTNVPTTGQTLTGQTSGATGVIVVINQGAGQNYMILTQLTGTFTTSEVVKVGATTIGTAIPQTVMVTAQNNAIYLQAAADQYRTLIGTVPGSGPVRGVVGVTFNNTDMVFAFRDNVGATATNLYQASNTGWQQVALLNTVSFTVGGNVTPADGATLTQGAVTATVKRVVAQSGSWTGSTAAGQLIITTPSGGGGHFAAGAATLTGGASVTLSGQETAITILPGGKFEMVIASYGGQVSTRRVFGCDNVNKGFEFGPASASDSTIIYVPIATGASPDVPKHVAWHRNHLFFGVAGAALFSGPGLQYRFLPADGGGEVDLGDNITNFIVQPGSSTTATMEITTRQGTSMLYGTGASDWNLVNYNTGTGAYDYTGQNLNQSFVLDDPGVINLQVALAYGNFVPATLTRTIHTFITAERARVACSSVNRDRAQYRIWFQDGFALWLTYVNNQVVGLSKILYPDPIFCTHYAEQLATGGEVSYAGANTSGYVYQTDIGASFDGGVINAYLVLNWNNQKSPRVRKRYRRASVEMFGNFYALINFGYQLGYQSLDIAQPNPASYNNYASNFAGSPFWDSFTWDNFTWDGVTVKPTEAEITGTAENIQYVISSATNYIYPYTIDSVTTHFTPRRGIR